jgi:uncharacterized membrane protein
MRNLILIILAWVLMRRVMRLLNSFLQKRKNAKQKEVSYEHLTDQEISDADYEEIKKK